MNLLVTRAAQGWRASRDALHEVARGVEVVPGVPAVAHGSQVENHRGRWVAAIPTPSTRLRHRCRCGASYWTFEGYRGHYSLVHLLDLDAL